MIHNETPLKNAWGYALTVFFPSQEVETIHTMDGLEVMGTDGGGTLRYESLALINMQLRKRVILLS